MTFLMTIDPGMSTGVTLGKYWETKEYERLEFWQVPGGLDGFHQWLKSRMNDWNVWDSVVVCEKFVPLPTPRSFKTHDLEPIRIEGAVAVLFRNVVWQRASAQVLAGGETPAQRKKNSDDVLRRMGLWTTGKQVGQKDANDVNSATKHAVSYLRSIKHEPTLKWLEG